MKSLARLVACAIAALWTFAAAAEEFDAAQEARVKELALQAILERPEILREAIGILQKRESTAKAASVRDTLAARRQDLERDPNAPVAGNPEGDVTIVEFFDYNCPYCKQAVDELEPVVDADGGIRLVYREYPILGEASVFAARAALASRAQGRYAEMHAALMSQRRVTEASTLMAAETLGLDIDRLKRDMDDSAVNEHIALSMALARDLGINGTPSFIIGNALAPGLVSSNKLEELVAGARSGR